MRFIQNKQSVKLPTCIVAAKEEQEKIALNPNRKILERHYKGKKIVVADVNDLHYGKVEYEARYILRNIFHNKCAYCECSCYEPDIEHYRPKGSVSGEQANAQDYYWLCYEWTNLLPACIDCNRLPSKGIRFPVRQKRITNPPLDKTDKLDWERCKANNNYLLQETPLLLHPEIDEPTQYFKLNWDGQLTPLGTNAQDDLRAKDSIDIYRLNRANLKIARADILDEKKEDILEHLKAFRKNEIVEAALQIVLKIPLRKLKRKQAPETPYSFVYYYICAHFEEFVYNFLEIREPLEAQLLIQVFKRI